MTLEILGEPEFLEWPRISTGMGDLSFIQMFYWTMTTISTVGYGDSQPLAQIRKWPLRKQARVIIKCRSKGPL